MTPNDANIHALIIDDEADIRELLSITLQRMAITSTCAANVSEAKQLLKAKPFHFCLTDMRLPDGDGMEIVRHIQQHLPELPVAVISAHGNMDLAIEAMKAGAFDFVSKPVELRVLRNVINTALQLASKDSRQGLDSDGEGFPLLGESPAMDRLRQQIHKLARSQAPVYISGESGSGKELVARAIHYHGPRSSGPFIPVNCGAIPKELMESEFFGHKKGSFTGANSDKQGLFQAAHGGTLFLDEVADLPLDMQVKLLRAIQEKAIRPVGAAQEIPLDVRILSATHKNLGQEVAQERFRSDLYYRINVIQLDVPPLRERQQDIPLLSEAFLSRFAGEAGIRTPYLADEALQQLKAYAFPGNVRELENILERAFTLCDTQQICAADLQLQAPSSREPSAADSGFAHSQGGYVDGETLDNYLENIEKEIIRTALEENRWNKTKTAEKLGISFRQMRYRLKKLGLDF